MMRAYVSSVAVGAVGAIGLMLGGWLADKMSVKRRNGRLVLSACCHEHCSALHFLRDQSTQGRHHRLHHC